MLTLFGLFFLYLQHLRAKSHFRKFSIATFEKWTFLKCPKIKIDPILFCKFFIFLSVKLFNNQIVLQNITNGIKTISFQLQPL